MSARPERIKELAKRLADEIEVARKEGMSELELGAALGLLLAIMAPGEENRRLIMDFAKRHANVRQWKGE